MTETAKKKRGMPSSFTILLILLAVVALITVAVAGITPEVTAARLDDFFMAPVRGFADALPVCLFVMILGGFLGMMTETGALDNGIAVLVKKLKGNELMIIPVLMFIFSLGGTSYGMCEETVPFYALLAATMMAAGFDPHGRCRRPSCWAPAAAAWAPPSTRLPSALPSTPSAASASRSTRPSSSVWAPSSGS